MLSGCKDTANRGKNKTNTFVFSPLPRQNAKHGEGVGTAPVRFSVSCNIFRFVTVGAPAAVFSLQSVIAILPVLFGKFRKKVMFQHAGYAHQQLGTDVRPLEYVIYIRTFARYSFGEPSRTFSTRKEYFFNSVAYIHSVRYFIIFAHKDNKFI